MGFIFSAILGKPDPKFLFYVTENEPSKNNVCSHFCQPKAYFNSLYGDNLNVYWGLRLIPSCFNLSQLFVGSQFGSEIREKGIKIRFCCPFSRDAECRRHVGFFTFTRRILM